MALTEISSNSPTKEQTIEGIIRLIILYVIKIFDTNFTNKEVYILPNKSDILCYKSDTCVKKFLNDNKNFELFDMPEFIKNVHKKVYTEFKIDFSNINFICANRNGVTGVFEI
jgi:hypothetical protein